MPKFVTKPRWFFLALGCSGLIAACVDSGGSNTGRTDAPSALADAPPLGDAAPDGLVERFTDDFSAQCTASDTVCGGWNKAGNDNENFNGTAAVSSGSFGGSRYMTSAMPGFDQYAEVTFEIETRSGKLVTVSVNIRDQRSNGSATPRRYGFYMLTGKPTPPDGSDLRNSSSKRKLNCDVYVLEGVPTGSPAYPVSKNDAIAAGVVAAGSQANIHYPGGVINGRRAGHFEVCANPACTPNAFGYWGSGNEGTNCFDDSQKPATGDVHRIEQVGNIVTGYVKRGGDNSFTAVISRDVTATVAAYPDNNTYFPDFVPNRGGGSFIISGRYGTDFGETYGLDGNDPRPFRTITFFSAGSD